MDHATHGQLGHLRTTAEVTVLIFNVDRADDALDYELRPGQ